MKKSEQKLLRESLNKILPGDRISREELIGKTPQERTDILLDRLVTPEQQERAGRYMNRTLVRISLREKPSDDVPPIDKIKLYARSGYHLHHIGTDEDFERVWEEAFKKENKFKFLADWRREKGGETNGGGHE
jgi:hypothetical protein